MSLVFCSVLGAATMPDPILSPLFPQVSLRPSSVRGRSLSQSPPRVLAGSLLLPKFTQPGVPLVPAAPTTVVGSKEREGQKCPGVSASEPVAGHVCSEMWLHEPHPVTAVG